MSQAMANQMAGVAYNTAMGQFVNSGVSRWFPGLFASLQALFNVGHSFVLRKLLLLMCPFIRRSQGAPSGGYSQPAWGDSSPGGPQCGGNVDDAGLKADVE